MANKREQFAQVFNDEVGDVLPEQVIEDEVAEEVTEEVPAEVAEEVAAEVAADEVAEAIAEEAAAGDEGELEGELDIEKEQQRLKSWEGRLKAKEAQLREKEAPAEDVVEVVEEAAEAVAEGVPADEVLAALEADFGQDYVQALRSLIDASVTRALGDVGEGGIAGRFERNENEVRSLIDALKSDRMREHFDLIADAHPDFMVVAQSQPFQEWVDGQGEETKNIVNAGSAREVVKLLNEFKKGQQGEDEEPANDPEDEGAAGVTSRGGLVLPTKPAGSTDFVAAWNEA